MNSCNERRHLTSAEKLVALTTLVFWRTSSVVKDVSLFNLRLFDIFSIIFHWKIIFFGANVTYAILQLASMLPWSRA